MSVTTTIPLNKLLAWDGNVRKTDPDKNIAEMAASIAAHGLLQSLAVRKDKRGNASIMGRWARYAFVTAWIALWPISLVSVFFLFRSRITAYARIPSTNPGISGETSEPAALPVGPILIVIIVVAIDLYVLWFLDSKIKQPPAVEQGNTKFQAKFRGFGGVLAATAGGALGSFLTILAVLIAAVLIVDHFT